MSHQHHNDNDITLSYDLRNHDDETHKKTTKWWFFLFPIIIGKVRQWSIIFVIPKGNHI